MCGVKSVWGVFVAISLGAITLKEAGLVDGLIKKGCSFVVVVAKIAMVDLLLVVEM